MIEISNERIASTEKILLNKGETFRDDKNERYDFISCVDKSIDVNACPGSGKTTCLLSKLILLSELMPFSDGRGICVLTHTNIAIDEIKKKLGTKANKLFSYPNHFGTFQSFVDKFLAMPFYRQLLNKPIIFIDNDIYEETICKKLNTLTFGTRKYLENHNLDIIIKARFSRTGNTLLKSIDGEKLFKSDGIVFNELFSLKRKLLKDGILCFDDAYFLAFRYLDKCPRLQEILSHRFGFLFIDEAQDSSPHQLELVNKLFSSNVVIQRIGDPDQAIMGNNLDIIGWQPSGRILSINTSKRFSNSIANVLKTICMKDNSSLSGNDQIENIPPYIIIYDSEEKRSQVLPKYVQLLKENNIDEKAAETNLPMKAIGWVGDGQKGKLTIQSYFPEFNKELNRKDKRNFDTLKSYLRKENKSNTKVYYDKILEAVLKLLYISDRKIVIGNKDKTFSKTNIINYLKEYDPNQIIYFQFLEALSKWGLAIHLSKEPFNSEVVSEARDYFSSTLLAVFKITANEVTNSFIMSEKEESFFEEQLNKKNLYIPEDPSLHGIKIEIANIHSVKGETHAATLYMETSYYGLACSEYIIDQLKGIPFDPNQKNVVNKSKCLKMAYVGMSRPKYFLAFAASANNILPHQEELKRNGWKIVSAD